MDFIEPTAATRRKRLVSTLLAIAAGALLAFVARPAWLAYLARLPECDRAVATFQWLLGSLAILPILALWAANLARKLWVRGQFPLPDAWVWRRTAIQRGWRVRLRAGVLMACAFALVGIAAYGWMTIRPMLGAASAQCAH